jgi:lambda repressor-like predicted transcriptional regulator
LLFHPAVHNVRYFAPFVNDIVYLMANDPDPKLLRSLIQRVLDEAPFSMRQLADEAGISYDAIRSWATDRRTPRPENLEHLAVALEHRGERLREIADEVRRAIG